ncbi:MAG: hypothetical protein GQ535_01445 [Rhodobacteraceae bacterium]|nr:hypothetical protein [Paracoccaceae bacterium]
MKNIVYIGVSLAVVAALHFSGVLTSFTLTHPIWRDNATLFGSLGGAVLSGLIFWACAVKPRLGRWLERLVIVSFLIILPVSMYYARVFIDSADYERMAVQIWHKGSYTVFVTFVASLSVLLAKLRIIGSSARG